MTIDLLQTKTQIAAILNLLFDEILKVIGSLRALTQ